MGKDHYSLARDVTQSAGQASQLTTHCHPFGGEATKVAKIRPLARKFAVPSFAFLNTILSKIAKIPKILTCAHGSQIRVAKFLGNCRRHELKGKFLRDGARF
jgi:hypothetical protein